MNNAAIAGAIAACTLLAAASPALAAPKKDNAQCTPNPVFGQFPNSSYASCDRSTFSTLELNVARDPGKLGGAHDKVRKEGETWTYRESIRPDGNKRYPSRLEVFRNFENALKDAGGTVLYTDSDRYLTYRVTRPSGEYWGQAGCGAGNAAQCNTTTHRIVRIAAMEQSVVLSADQIRSSLADTGKVVFYGIYFDTDKATLKKESDPTLAEMAKFLKANASTNVFIVGHTDMQGPLERNQKLSRDRAAAVVAALASAHGIPRERMAADGVGPLAPVAANDADAGRARNRRVEMVLR